MDHQKKKKGKKRKRKEKMGVGKGTIPAASRFLPGRDSSAVQTLETLKPCRPSQWVKVSQAKGWAKGVASYLPLALLRAQRQKPGQCRRCIYYSRLPVRCSIVQNIYVGTRGEALGSKGV